MDNYLVYFGKVALATGIFYLAYLILFQNGKQFVFKRIYLLLSLVLSIIIPLISFTKIQYMEIPVYETNSVPSVGYTLTNNIPDDPSPGINHFWPYIIIGLYILGGAFFLIQLLIGHIGAIRILKSSSKINLFGKIVHITKNDVHPFSFFNKIVLSEKTLNNSNLHIIVAHEHIHVKEIHTLDILFAEVVFMLQWFNPFAWLLKAEVKNNLEFKTDHEVIKTNDPVAYQMSMVSMAGQKEVAPFLTALNGSQLKKRIVMMKTKTDSRFTLIKQLIVIPLLAILTMGLSNKEVITEYIQQQKDNVQIKNELENDVQQANLVPVKNSEQLNLVVSAIKSENVSITDSIIKSNEPLYFVDGKVTKNIIQIPPDDIESIDVLKDKSASKLYGNKGKNGVVLITTKSKSYNYLDDNAQNVRPIPKDEIRLPEEMPEFPGGEEALRQHIANNIRYPEIAKEKGIHGRVYVTVTISKEGKVTNPVLSRGVYPPMDKEAIRVVSSMPDWKPGKHNGQTVEVAGYRIPIDFVLKDDPVRINRIKQNIPLPNPLYIVDGKEAENINDIPAENIKNIEVLKDKAGINLYGQKGKKGVVVITTKQYAERNKITTELALRQFIANNIKYPIEAHKKNIQETVDLWADVEYNGQITHFYENKPGGTVVPIDDIVVVGYSTKKKRTNSSQNIDITNDIKTLNNKDTSELASLLTDEVKRVSRTLPSIDVSGIKGETVRLRVKFMLQE